MVARIRNRLPESELMSFINMMGFFLRRKTFLFDHFCWIYQYHYHDFYFYIFLILELCGIILFGFIVITITNFCNFIFFMFG